MAIVESYHISYLPIYLPLLESLTSLWERLLLLVKESMQLLSQSPADPRA